VYDSVNAQCFVFLVYFAVFMPQIICCHWRNKRCW